MEDSRLRWRDEEENERNGWLVGWYVDSDTFQHGETEENSTFRRYLRTTLPSSSHLCVVFTPLPSSSRN